MTQIACYTDPGPRENLEDVACGLIVKSTGTPVGEVPILTIYDGAGGCNAGEVASGLATREVTRSLTDLFTPGGQVPAGHVFAPDAVLDHLIAVLVDANTAVVNCAAQSNTLSGMATTAVCGVILHGTLFVAWAGDSRAYLYSNGSLHQLTRDHSAVQELIELGLLSSEQAKHHHLAHTITRYLGQIEGFGPETRICRIVPGDIVLMCTDGLTDVVSDAGIAEIVGAYEKDNAPLNCLPIRLIEHALTAGTQDNVTVLCCTYEPLGAREHLWDDQTLTGTYPAATAKRNFHVTETLT